MATWKFPMKKKMKQPPSESDVHCIGLERSLFFLYNLEPRHPPQSSIWLLSDFQLFEPIKGQQFPDNDAVIAVGEKVRPPPLKGILTNTACIVKDENA